MANEQQLTKTRWARLVCACLVMIAIGFIYGWSVFSVPISNEFGWEPTTLSFTFTILMWAFCLGGILGAKLTAKTSARATLLVSAVGIFLGFLLTTVLVGPDTPWMLYITYGFIGGCSVGMAYTTTMGSIIIWFPDKAGTISGTMLLCYGLSTMILSSVASWLFGAIGWRPAFITLSACMGVIVFLNSLALRKPTADELNDLSDSLALKAAVKHDEQEVEEILYSGINFKTSEMLKQPVFYAYAIWMILTCSVGLGLTGTMNQLSLEAGAAVALAVGIVGLYSVFNGLGRLAGGFVFDKLGIPVTMAIVGVFHVAGCVLIILAIATQSIPLMLVAAVVGASGVGSSSVVGSGFTATAFGSEHYAQNLSVLNLMLIPAALIGPLIMSTSVGSAGTYTWGLVVLSVVGLVTIALSAVTGRNLKKMRSGEQEVRAAQEDAAA